MREANRPSGPGKPTSERRDAATEQEGVDEASRQYDAETADDPTADAIAADEADRRRARQAERDANERIQGSGSSPDGKPGREPGRGGS